jgi:hypothetical protein
MFAVIILCVLFNQFVFHITPPQPEPTSQLITKNIVFTNKEVVGIFNGFGCMGVTMELFDENGNGYYYLSQPFNIKIINIGDNYTIQYYCNKNDDRQIYSFTDNTPQLSDRAKCEHINGTCQ